MVSHTIKCNVAFKRISSATLPACRNVLNMDLTVKGKLLNDIYSTYHYCEKEKKSVILKCMKHKGKYQRLHTKLLIWVGYLRKMRGDYLKTLNIPLSERVTS